MVDTGSYDITTTEVEIIRWLKKCLIITALLLCGLVVLDRAYPIPDPLSSPSLVVTAKDGEVLRRFSNGDGILREQITLDQVSPFYLQSLLTYEDKWFYSHFGVNPFSLIRAGWQWLTQGRVISGGSTITMQVARLLDPHRRTVLGKAKQMLRALQLEYHLSKQEILTLYVNLAPFGGNIEGIQAASRKYFAKTAAELTLNEAALLVVLPQRPSLYRPDRYLERAALARNKVLHRLNQSETLSTEVLERLIKEPILLTPQQDFLHSPLLARRLLKSPRAKTGVVQTTIDYQLQSELESYLKNKKKSLAAGQSVAVLVLNNITHEVIAYRGSLDLFDAQRHGFVDMVQGIRSPGSTLKPFIYGMALDRGLIHEQSLLTDVPRNFDGYAPHNFDRRYHGAVSVAEALQLSLNIPVVQVLSHMGAASFAEPLQSMGLFSGDTEANLSLALGGFGTNLFQLTRFYSALANRGRLYPSYFEPQNAAVSLAESVTAQPAGQSLLSPEASWVIWHILAEQSESSSFNTGTYRQVAWKTGTSYGFRDAWSIGVSPDYTVGIWLGRPDGAPSVGSYGSKDATPIMFDIFALLPGDKTTISRPENIEHTVICWPTGYARALTEPQLCEQQRDAWTISGRTPPTLYSDFTDAGWPKEIVKWRASRVLPEQILPEQTLPDQKESARIKADPKKAESKNIVSERTESNSNTFGKAGEEQPVQKKQVQIIGLKNNSIIFSYPGQIMTLKATLTDVNWYLNDELLSINRLELDRFSGQKLRITACQRQTIQCDSVDIDVN